MIRLIFFSFVVLMHAVNAADDRLVVTLTNNTGSTLTTPLQAREDYLKIPAQNLTMAKNALPLRIEKIMQQEDLSTVSEQELQCIQDYLENKKSEEYRKWVNNHDCSIMCGLISTMAAPSCIAGCLAYLCADLVGVETAENTFNTATIAAIPVGGYLSYKFAQYYQPDESGISKKIERVSQALRRKQKQD